MNDIPYKKQMDPKAKALVIIFILLIAGAFIGIIVSKTTLGFFENRIAQSANARPYWPAFVNNYSLVTIVICMNLSLLAGLLCSYIKSFRITKSGFLLGLVLFLMVLFVQSLLSIPFLNLIMSITSMPPKLGFTCILISYQSMIFTILANMFETIALIILYYLSSE